VFLLVVAFQFPVDFCSFCGSIREKPTEKERKRASLCEMCTCDVAKTSKNDAMSSAPQDLLPLPLAPRCCPFVSLFNNCAFRKRVCWLVACLFACPPAIRHFHQSALNLYNFQWINLFNFRCLAYELLIMLEGILEGFSAKIDTDSLTKVLKNSSMLG